MTQTLETPAHPSIKQRVVEFIRRHPIASYLLIFNLLGQPFAFAPVIAHRVYGVELNADLILMIPAILFMGGAALLITRIARGPQGLRDLVRSALKVNVPLRWYLLPFVVFPVLMPLLQFATPAPDWTFTRLAVVYVTGFLPALAFQFLSTNLWEETAWQGLVQNTFQDRYGPWKAVLLTTPWFLMEHAFFAFQGTWLDGVIWVVAFLVVAVPVRALMGWIYNRTGSIFLVGLTHASTNAVGATLMTVIYGVAGASGLALLVPGAVVLLLTRGRLGLPAPAERAD